MRNGSPDTGRLNEEKAGSRKSEETNLSGTCNMSQQLLSSRRRVSRKSGIPDNCYGHHGRCPCKNILSGVKFSRLNTKTAYILLFRDIFQCFEVFLVNFPV